MADQSYIYAVGKRKTAVAQVRLYLDQGPIVVDEKLMEEAFPYSIWQQIINEPFTVTNTEGKYRVVAMVVLERLDTVLLGLYQKLKMDDLEEH